MLPFIMQKCGQISNRMHSCSICRDLLTIRAAAATLCVSTIPPIGSSCCSSFAVVRRLSSSAYVQHMLDELMLIVHIIYIISIIYTVCLCPTQLDLACHQQVPCSGSVMMHCSEMTAMLTGRSAATCLLFAYPKARGASPGCVGCSNKQLLTILPWHRQCTTSKACKGQLLAVWLPENQILNDV